MVYKKNSRRADQQQPIDPNYAHLQPQAPEIERAVLGALLIDKDAFETVCKWLTPETFYLPNHQKIYSAIRDLAMAEKPVDVLTVTEKLAKMGLLEDIGGPATIGEISGRVATSANIDYHARILAQKYLKRQLISTTSDIQTKAFDDTIDVDDLMEHAEGRIYELAKRDIKQDFCDIKETVKESYDKTMRAYSNKGELTGVPTGYFRLDEVTNGWQNTDFVVLAGRPAMGKTSFALSLLKNIAVDRRIPANIPLYKHNLLIHKYLRCIRNTSNPTFAPQIYPI